MKTSIKNIKKDTYALTFEAEIAPKWHLYSQFSDPDGAIPTQFIFNENVFFIIRPIKIGCS